MPKIPTGEALATLIHRAEYGESVALYIDHELPGYNKMAGYAALYARMILPALREIVELRAEVARLKKTEEEPR